MQQVGFKGSMYKHFALVCKQCNQLT